MTGLRLRPGGPDDVRAVLALFDEAVAWLVERGQPGQWGETPVSERPRMREQVARWAAGDGLWVAEDESVVVGALVVGEHPPHVEPVDEPELYVELLLTSRRRAGEGIGSLLVKHARALAGERLLRVDCWAGAPSLVAWYERQGFARTSTFDLDGWVGQVFASRP